MIEFMGIPVTYGDFGQLRTTSDDPEHLRVITVRYKSDSSGHIRSHLGSFGVTRIHLELLGVVQSGPESSEVIWITLYDFRRLQTCPNYYSQLNLDSSGLIWSRLDSLSKVIRIHLEFPRDVRSCLKSSRRLQMPPDGSECFWIIILE